MRVFLQNNTNADMVDDGFDKRNRKKEKEADYEPVVKSHERNLTLL